MPRLHTRYTPIDYLFGVVAAAFALLAAGLTVFVLRSHDEAVIPLLYPLIPGLIPTLLMMGGHGGTPTGGLVCVAATINALVYGTLCLLPRWIWRRLTAQRNRNFNL